MPVWYAKAIVVLASGVMVAIRAPHGQRSRGVNHRLVTEGVYRRVDRSWSC
jgi:hypothetical protein